MGKVVHAKNFEQWSVVSDTYHTIRPTPPEAVVKIILSWLGKEPDTVVDVGCGTGLSTGIWKDAASNIIGIEPNSDMRAIAEKHMGSDHIIFKNGVSNETNLPSDYADIITVSQAFHWMDIDSSLSEFYRVLKKGGILAIYDAAWPIVDWEVDKAVIELREKMQQNLLCH